MPNECPICDELECPANAMEDEWMQYNCPNCGEFNLPGTNRGDAAARLMQKLGPVQKAILSHAVWKMQRPGEVPELELHLVERILSSNAMPSPIEQVNNAILYVGGQQRDNPGVPKQWDYSVLRAKLGACNADGVRYVKELLESLQLLRGRQASGVYGELTFKGWEKYEKLVRGSSESRLAFMAMPFKSSVADFDLDKVYKECFKVAVRATGFELRRVDEEPRAGLIDDQIRTDIRTSRFLIAELTGDNRGAYWEAGFAEGLGKPVIYTCETGYFSDQETHFDTNHHLTVKWEVDHLDEAARQLKATIRATLPDEARMTDEPDGE